MAMGLKVPVDDPTLSDQITIMIIGRITITCQGLRVIMTTTLETIMAMVTILPVLVIPEQQGNRISTMVEISTLRTRIISNCTIL